MEVEKELITGLKASPKYIPQYYRYDQAGSTYNDDVQRNCSSYYLTNSTKELLKNIIHEIIEYFPLSTTLVDTGCGSAEIERIFFDEYISRHGQMKFVPVDVSHDFLLQVCSQLNEIYGKTLTIDSIASEYSQAIPKIAGLPGPKVITWISAILNLPYGNQVEILGLISEIMTGDDLCIVSFDITQDKKTIEEAYLDTNDLNAKLYLNAVQRLNRELGADIDLTKFTLEGSFVENRNKDIPGAMHIWLRSLCEQSYKIDSLSLELHFKEGEKFYMNEQGGVSHKYSDSQIVSLTQRANLVIAKKWKNQNCALVLLQKMNK